MGDLLYNIWLVISCFFWPLIKQFFLTDILINAGIIIFIVIAIYGGVMTGRQERDAKDIAALLTGIIGTITLLASK